MTFSKYSRLAVLFVSTLIVGACTADTTADTSLFGRVSSYLDENITDLSPRTATEGKFTVSNVEWVDEDTIRVTYEDEAGVVLHATGDIDENGSKLITNFRIDTSLNNSSSSSSDMSDSSTMTASSAMSDDDDDSSSSSSSTSVMSVMSAASSL